MKKLIYFPLVLFINLLDVSCTKDPKGAVAPAAAAQQPVASSATVDLDNNSGTAYAVEFIGTTKYDFDMPAHSKQEVSIKGDNYNIEVSSSGTATPSSIEWNGQTPVKALHTNFTGVAISGNSLDELLIF
jgi:hypothetical protein